MEEENFLLNNNIYFGIQTQTLPQKGNMAWEYNPLRNYRLTENKYKYNNLEPLDCTNGAYYSLVQLEDLFGITIGGSQSEILNKGFKGKLRDRISGDSTTDTFYKCTVNNEIVTVGEEYKIETKENEFETPNIEVYEAGQIIDFQTDELKFDLNHPVDILPQYSYDNSVNLILNDGTNVPRLINTRFSSIGRDKYEIVDRKGDNDTNIYDQGDLFDIDTSLYKRTIKIPKLEFKGVYPGGNLKVGNYHFYFKYVDADDNETDWIAESGLVSIFIGNSPHSILSGFSNENSRKLVKFRLNDIDSSYSYVKVYYTKESSDTLQKAETTNYVINLKFIVDANNCCDITISGFVDDTEIDETEINIQYLMVSCAETQASCKNMLFLANVHKPDIPYKELEDLSLRFLPFRHLKNYELELDSQYNISSSENGYYDPKFIYNFTGYWNNDIYRLGVVYILPDNSLSPVFNIRGGYNLNETSKYTTIDLYQNVSERKYISVDEKNYQIIKEDSKTVTNVELENAKGVITLATINSAVNKFQIYGIQIKAQSGLMSELSKYVKGFFFVRQKRMPTTLCQAITIAQDKNSYTPVLPMGKKGGMLAQALTGVAFTQPRRKATFADVLNNDESLSNKKVNDVTKNLGKNVLKNNTEYYASESFLDSENRYLTNDFLARVRPLTKSRVNINTALCPEFEVDLPFYRSVFTGDDFTVELSDMLPERKYFDWNSTEERNFYISDYVKRDNTGSYSAKVLAIPDSSKLMAIGTNSFRGKCGNPQEAYRYEYIGYDNKVELATNFLRGNFGPYLGFVGGTSKPLTTYDVKIPGYTKSNMSEYFNIRYNDNSEYFAISERYSIDDYEDPVLYRGDCYICQFTHRLNRNFQDPAAPNNSTIVDHKCWSDNYVVKDGVVDKTGFRKINLGDVNAVKLGMWTTFIVRSTKNLCIRGIDESHHEEFTTAGHGRGFYPHFKLNLDGSYKIPESEVFNKGFLKEAGIKRYFEVADVPYLKNEFTNRILFSNPAVNDSFVNNFRVFESSHFKDYSKEYGQITKIVEQNGNLLVIFEHGIGYISVNQKALLEDAETKENIYVGSGKVLSEPTIISDKFGSLWKESIIKTPYYVYGVDTVAKKIWRVTTGSSNVETISDTRIASFLHDNISLGEREKDPIIGIRNVKTHYNAYKQDVMFTFYDNLQGFEEKVWNVCWNELSQIWTTMYSWVPSYSANIFNQYFSFDRNTSKWIAKLGISKTGNNFSDGITVSNNIIDDSEGSEYLEYCQHIVPDGYLYSGCFYDETKVSSKESIDKYKDAIRPLFIGYLTLSNRSIQSDYSGVFKLEHDTFENYKYFLPDAYSGYAFELENASYSLLTEDSTDESEISLSTEQMTTNNNGDLALYLYRPFTDDTADVVLINVSCELINLSKNEEILTSEGYYLNVIAVALKSSIYGKRTLSIDENGNPITDNEGKYVYVTKSGLTTDFWKHGKAGLQDICEKILPTKWYGKQHPFEIEFIVNEYPETLKIFDNLQIISNNAEPESFHYQIIGDSLEFANDKRNMYIRQEATKELYQYNGSDILYDSDWKNIENEGKNSQNPKSNILPQLYEARLDTFNEIEDYYKSISVPNKNYDELTGSEITHDKITDEFGVWTHSKAVNIEDEGGRLRGNMIYRNDTWRVQVSPINFVQKNETIWENGKVPITLANVPVPAAINDKEIKIPDDEKDRTLDISSWSGLPLILKNGSGDDAKYTYVYGQDDNGVREETKIRDKYIKIRIRYSGEKLAIINKIITIYSATV